MPSSDPRPIVSHAGSRYDRTMRCLLVLLAACGGGGSDSPADAPKQPDADMSATCLIPGNHGDLGTKTGTQMMGIPTSLSVTIDPGPPRDTFFINLKNGMGVFAAGMGGLRNGTFQIAGAELSQSTCGLCVNIIADIVAMQGPSKFYFATGGTVTLTATNPPAGTISNVTFVEVTSGGTPTNSGCTGRINALAFGP